jgi:hypothetical protein
LGEAIVAEDSYVERAIEVSNLVLNGEVGIIEAAIDLSRLARLDSSIMSEADSTVFAAIASETDDPPIGRVRQDWRPEALREKDIEIARCEDVWREQVRSACERIRRAALIRKLIVHGHVNDEQGRSLGAIDRQEVPQILRSLLLMDGVFPAAAIEGVVYEGASIARVLSGLQITLQLANAERPSVVAERGVENFSDMESAIERYIDLEWSQGIDGIPFGDGTR